MLQTKGVAKRIISDFALVNNTVLYVNCVNQRCGIVQVDPGRFLAPPTRLLAKGENGRNRANHQFTTKWPNTGPGIPVLRNV